MASGIRKVDSSVELDLCPVADGGEGSHDVVMRAGFSSESLTVRSADGERLESVIALRGPTAVLELARLCGAVTLRGDLRPWTSHTSGLGDAVRVAIQRGAAEIVMCLGGSASVDGGTGLIAALGYELWDAAGRLVQPGLADLARIHRVVLPQNTLRARMIVVCDVASPLLGEEGGIKLFSGQKGLNPLEVSEAERRMKSWAEVSASTLGRDCSGSPGSGSAGGAGFAAIAYLGAEFYQGLDYFDELLGLSARIARADLVVTGEGMFDRGSLAGKAPVGVARRAVQLGRPCVLVAGQVHLDPAELHPFNGYWSLTQMYGRKRAMDESAAALSDAVAHAFTVWRGSSAH